MEKLMDVKYIVKLGWETEIEFDDPEEAVRMAITVLNSKIPTNHELRYGQFSIQIIKAFSCINNNCIAEIED